MTPHTPFQRERYLLRRDGLIRYTRRLLTWWLILLRERGQR